MRAGTVVAAVLLATAAVPPSSIGAAPDTTPPQTTITSGPAEGEVINSDGPQFAWASSEAPATFRCTADGIALAKCEDAFITGARNGPHSFTVVATDAAGNTDPTPATRTFTVRLMAVPPVIPRCQVDGNVITATDADDTRVGTAGTDIIFGLRGDDLLRGLSGADCLAGGSGDDSLFAGSADDYLFGNGDNDRLVGESGDDELYGNAGNDRITGGAGRDLLDGGTGSDRLGDVTGRDSFSGGAGNDRIDARDTSRAGRRIADSVRCGSGRFDVATVDRADDVARDCERVLRR